MSTPKRPHDCLLVMALPQESRGRLEAAGAELLFTGVGKVNAVAALARVCRAERASFGCAKYVTDGADADSAAHWRTALDAASRAFERIYRELQAQP